jgi:ABC-type bacteriocin/lantibiotic exporter with double-glycine peptidase domain
VDEQGSQVSVPTLGYAEQPWLASGGMLTRNQAEPCTQIPGFGDIALSPLEEGEAEKSNDEPDFTKPLVLDRVFYRYGTNEPMVLNGASLTIAPGEFIAITGPSGGGKTTLMKILMGLFEPTSGAIRLGDRPISSYRKGKYRRCIGSVAQGDMLYAGSLAENIAFFDPELDMVRVHEVARMAQIDSEIEKMPMGYETLVGDMGSVLSGGQLQRVLLARALYPDPKALILDEGTANLDAENEARILKVLKELSITRIAVAHRPATLLAAQRVVAVTAGELQEILKETPKADEGPRPMMNETNFTSAMQGCSHIPATYGPEPPPHNEQSEAPFAPPPLGYSTNCAEYSQREEKE